MTNAAALESILGQLQQLRDPAGYLNAGIPNYNHLFGRDAAVSALQLMHREPEVARATLLVLAKFQGKKRRLRREEWPGKILHEHFPYGVKDMLSSLIHNDHRLRVALSLILWRFPYYASVDAGAWYLILLSRYYRQTKDEALVRSLWPKVQGIIGWLNHHAIHRSSGLVTFRSHFIFGLQNQSWKDTINNKIKPPVAMVEVQGYYYYALREVADLADEALGDQLTAQQLRTQADQLQAAFQVAFQPINGVIPTAVDGQGQHFASVTSNPGHLLFTGILDATGTELVADRLFAEDMMTPYGIRTEATSEASFNPNSYQNGSIWPFDNWVIHQGLHKTGRFDQAAQIKTSLINVFEAWNNLPELYAVETNGDLHGINAACYIQAWSAGALIHLLDDAPAI